VITSASGVEFSDCHSKRDVIEIEGIPVNFISLEDLKTNKAAAKRHKDSHDLDHLPFSPTGRPSRLLPGWPLWKKSDPNTTGGNSMLSKDFKEFIELLNSNSASISKMVTRAESKSFGTAMVRPFLAKSVPSSISLLGEN
jgi:hypothetical protein